MNKVPSPSSSLGSGTKAPGRVGPAEAVDMSRLVLNAPLVNAHT